MAKSPHFFTRVILKGIKGLWLSFRFVINQIVVSLKNQSRIVRNTLAKTFTRKDGTKKPIPGSPHYELLTEVESKVGSWKSYESKLFQADSFIALILGARGSGKTALGMKLLENAAANGAKKCCAMGFDASELPSWIKPIVKSDEIENDSFVLVDEGGILFSSRESMKDKNKLLSDLIFIARHKNLSIFFITQNSSTIEVNVLRQADVLFLKPSSLLQLDFERKKIRDIYASVIGSFEKYSKTKGLTYVYGTDFSGFIANPLPTFWSQRVSKSFREIHETSTSAAPNPKK
jgi:hypothetical protein